MNIIKKNTLLILAVIVLVLLVFMGTISYYIFIESSTQMQLSEATNEIYDDRISPDINQGLTVEVLRIRNRGLMEKMLIFGTRWKKTPSYYWIIDVDGKIADSSGFVGFGSSGTFITWDTLGMETKQNYYIGEETETSNVCISIIEQVNTGLFGRKTTTVEKEMIRLVYDFRTGRWSGDDSFMDSDGYGHYLGESYEVWLNLYQADFDHDGIPYWIEVNVLGTDPTVDDSTLDPDYDDIPTNWEWKWGYDPMTWDDHTNLDPDVDGIENTEEYQMRKYFANPFQPDIYIETDGMKRKNLRDINHVFWKESQQIVIERFAQHGIWVYIDDGWDDGPVNAGGELVPFIEEMDDVLGGQVKAFYDHNFADERKGIFRYVLIVNSAAWITPPQYNSFDTINIGTNKRLVRKSYGVFTPRYHRVVLAKKVIHELGHSIGLMPSSFAGVDIKKPVGIRYPSMPAQDYESLLNDYHSVMNYYWMGKDRKLVDYSDGSNGAPYDQDDWAHIYLPTFQTDAVNYEESVDETFEDFEIVNDYQGVQLKGWTYDQNLTHQYQQELTKLVYVKNAGCNMSVFINMEKGLNNSQDIRIYAMPNVSPTHTLWSLVAQGKLNSNREITFYSLQSRINQVKQIISST
ncbi:MAG: hypothetical protein JW840_06410 [Candidatus Thermoplasmatota archaeon]|nr:hypothetical protein [Candidatus Thermoplasmatota archaeon]